MEPEPLTSAPHRVEAFLDQILASLGRGLSPFYQEELRREMRAHLWARVDAYGELGQAEDEAVTEALRQFGGADDFLRQWRQEWRAVDRRGLWREIWDAAKPAMHLSLLALISAPAVVALAGFLAFRSPLGGPFLGALFNVVFAGVVLLPPLAFGLAQSRRATHRPGQGMFAALSAQIIGLSTISWLAGRLLPDQNPIIECLNALLLLTYLWLPVACASASLGGRWTQRRKKVTA